MSDNDLITEYVIYEAYFDLWGFSVNWIKAIQDKLLDFANPGDGEECEAYTEDTYIDDVYGITNDGGDRD